MRSLFSILLQLGSGRFLANIPQECIHHLEDGQHVTSSPDGDFVIDTAGATTFLPPCSVSSSTDGGVGYFSDWIVDTVAVHENITQMISNWTVPKEPASRGPVPGMSSAYLFNGLEDGNGVPGKANMILQPVLSFGKSGCVLDPFAGWRFTAFQVTLAGRAYCGKSIAVQEGDRLQGTMQLVADKQWEIIADAGAKGKSVRTLTAGFKANAAYLTLEGMVIYNCKALPQGSVAFTNNVLQAIDGSFEPKWKSEIRRAECNPGAKTSPNGDVELSWLSGASEIVL